MPQPPKSPDCQNLAGDPQASGFQHAAQLLAQARAAHAAGEARLALDLYLQRAAMGFAPDDVFACRYAAARLMEALDYAPSLVLAAWQDAAAAGPDHAEAQHAAARYCRGMARFTDGLDHARRGLVAAQLTPLPAAEAWIGEYGLLEELAENAAGAGAWRQSLDAALRLLALAGRPDEARARYAEAAQLAAGRLPEENLGAAGAISPRLQHAMLPLRPLQTRLAEAPRVLLAMLPDGAAALLPFWLHCIEMLDYPKSAIVLQIRLTDGDADSSRLLGDYIARLGHLYARVAFDDSPLPLRHVAPERRRAHVRNACLRHALEQDCDFCFVVDPTSFIRPSTLLELAALNLPVVAPLLRPLDPAAPGGNFAAEIDAAGDPALSDQSGWIARRLVRGVLEVPAVGDCYLVRADVLNELSYEDEEARADHAVFSLSARSFGIPLYVDNRQLYGYTAAAADAGNAALARRRLGAELNYSQGWRTAYGEAAPTRVKAPPVRPVTRRQKTLVFCTAFAWTPLHWTLRYRRWVQGIRASSIAYDQLLVVDDGSDSLPDWSDAEIRRDETAAQRGLDGPSNAELLVHSFRDRLGRASTFDFPGWYRSFAFAGRYARAHGFEKVVHIESDLYLIGQRPQRFVNEATEGWTIAWCPLHLVPESGFQVMAGSAVQRFAEIEQSHPHESLVGRAYELQLPYDRVDKSFAGNRYGEFQSFVPGNAEYAAQINHELPPEYYWWLPGIEPAPRGNGA